MVDQKYVKSFIIRGERITVHLKNPYNAAIKPNVTIVFLNEQGFVTGQHLVWWLFSDVDPGGRQIDTGYIKFSFGESVYYTLRFD